jgi:hypothetical protein
VEQIYVVCRYRVLWYFTQVQAGIQKLFGVRFTGALSDLRPGE